MGAPINLLDRLLSEGRRLIYLGRRVEARRRLEKFLGLPSIPDKQRVEAHQLLADIHLDNQCYRRSRRHLLAALGLQPECADTVYRLAVTLDMDPDMSPKRAAKYYRKAVELKPDEARYWSGYGQVCLRLGKEKAAHGALAAAADLAPMDIDVIDEITEGLCFLGREDDARAVLIAARFRLGHTGELEALWNRFRFLEVQRKQIGARRQRALAAGEAVVLPFVPARESSGGKGEPGILRHDRFSKSAPHSTQRNNDPKRIP